MMDKITANHIFGDPTAINIKTKTINPVEYSINNICDIKDKTFLLQKLIIPQIINIMAMHEHSIDDIFITSQNSNNIPVSDHHIHGTNLQMEVLV